MADISLFTKNDLRSLGLNASDIATFIDLRVRYGALTSPEALERVTNALSPNGAKAIKAAVRTQGFVVAPTPLNNVMLTLVPNPPMRSQPGVKLTISFRRQVDDEDFETPPIPFSLSGETGIPIADVNLAHLIYFRVTTAAGTLVAERVLAPVEIRGEVRGTAWVATPPLGAGESVDANARALVARLLVNTLRPAAAPPKPTASAPVFARSGRFVVIGQPTFGFAGYALSAALATPALLAAIASALDTSSGSTAAQARFSASDARFAALVAALPLVAGEIDFAGTFRLRQQGASPAGIKGWVWVLTGPDTVVGFRPDPRPVDAAPDALIYLQSDLVAQPASGLPTDVNEATLLSRPDLFTDDPGSTCRPFSSPGRILGEKRFRTALRVTQPQVALAGLNPISFEDQSKRPVAFPRRGVDPENEIEYEADPSRFQAQSVAFGHIIEHVVRYRSNGYSLGNVAHSLTLAPREKRRIMKVEFARTETASREEDTGASDQAQDSLDAHHSYDDVVSGALNEWSRGRSSSVSAGAAAGAGGLAGPVVIGGGLSGGGAQSDASQHSHRDTTARESQNLRDAIRRFGESLRKLESTVVTESTQTETVTGVSEVVQNINYTRALSIVYYEILRHLRVDTEVAAVSECIFVPMPIRPFTDERIARHRSVLSRFARGWLEKSVFQNLDDIQRDFSGSEVPDGKQADHPLTRLSGSLTLKMSVDMPAEGTATGPSTTDPDAQLLQTSSQLEIAWEPYASLIPMPVGVLAKTLAGLRTRPAEAERLFRTQIAPAMARAALNSLTLTAAQSIEHIDFTLANAYKRGQPLRVDFDVAVNGTLTRRMLEHMVLRLKLEVKLPRGSWVNLTGATIEFATQHYQGRRVMSGGNRDLIDPVTGVPDLEGAMIEMPCTDTDNLHLRNLLREGYRKLKQALAANPFRYHKAIWMGMDRDELYALLDGYAISPTDGRSIASVIDPKPLGILGNSLVFATRTDWPLDEQFATFTELKARYTSGLPLADPIRISLPTSGLYARAHMDDCIAAEEHNGSFDWVFESTEPELADFPTGMFASRATAAQGLAPTALPDTIINLQNAPANPAPTGLSSTLTALGTEAFRDITGLAGTQENLRAAMSNATNLATSGMSQGAKLAELASDARAGKDLNSFSAAIKKAVNEGQLPAETGAKALANMAERKGNGSQPPASDLHGRVLDSDGEVSHSSTDPDGTTKTTMKKAPTPRPEPKTDVFVIPIPNATTPQVLFLNFATGKSELRPKHIDYLKDLAAIVGVTIEDVVSMEGHASTSGSEKANFEFGTQRALAVFERLHQMVQPLGAKPDYSPANIESSGEISSFRSRLADVPEIARIPGADDPNDPVEKAVLLTLRPGVDLRQKRKPVDLGGVDIFYLNNYVYIGGDIFCSLPDGPVKQISGNTVKVLSENQVKTEVQIGDTSIFVTVGDIAANLLNNINFAPSLTVSIGNGNSVSFPRDSATGTLGAPTITPPLADQLRDSWKIKLFEPEIVSSKSMLDLLAQVADLIFPMVSRSLLPSGAPQILKNIANKAGVIAADSATPDKTKALVDFLIDELKLTDIKALLGKIRFGQIRMRGQIKVEEGPPTNASVLIDGMFSAPGIIIGTVGTTATPGTPSATVILDNASYRTSKKLTLNSWENQPPFREFSFIDNGVVSVSLAGDLAAATLLSGLQDLVTEVMPDIVSSLADAAAQSLFNLLGEVHELVARYAPNGTLLFRAFKDDDINQIPGSAVTPTGAELRMITMTPNAIAFTKT